MAKQTITAPRGTQDVLPEEIYKWQYVESKLIELSSKYGFKETRFPTFENTALFARGVGDTTDVVQKEMYTFMDKGDRSITLRPEGTASTVRSILEHGLLNAPMPLKVNYLISCFRYEKPQAGRYREFKQFGAEVFGSQSPAVDAELICFINEVFTMFKIEDISLEMNSIGCPKCRPAYFEKLKAYFEQYREDLCPTCKERLDKNPMRILDCKSDTCAKIAKDAPLGIDNLCQECEDHFDSVKERLSAMGIDYTVNPMIVRGLDYYTKTVFEFVSSKIGAQGTVCGGGRYDGLFETLGGSPTPAIGFAIGLQRLLAVMENAGVYMGQPAICDLYIASMGEQASKKAQVLAQMLRRDGIYVESDVQGRGFNAQMKYANKIGAKFCVVLGDEEIATGTYKLKNMQSGEQTQVDDSTILQQIQRG